MNTYDWPHLSRQPKSRKAPSPWCTFHLICITWCLSSLRWVQLFIVSSLPRSLPHSSYDTHYTLLLSFFPFLTTMAERHEGHHGVIRGRNGVSTRPRTGRSGNWRSHSQGKRASLRLSQFFSTGRLMLKQHILGCVLVKVHTFYSL